MEITATVLLPDTSQGFAVGPGGLRRSRWAALGTTCELQFVCDDAVRAEKFRHAAVGWVANFETRYSRFRPDSLLSKINAAAGQTAVKIDAEMDQMLNVCAALHEMTQGILDVTALPLMRLWDYRSGQPRIPAASEIASARSLVGWAKVQREPGQIFLPLAGMALDFGGWGKEFAVDAVAQIARDHGITNALIDFGHDLRALGTPPGKPGWHIGLEDPARPGIHRGSIAVRERGIASSGDYLRSFTINGRRYGHIIDPRSGCPVANGCLQATVVAPTCLQAGVLSTVAFVLGGQKGVEFIQQTLGSEGCIMTERARYQTRSFFQYVVEN